MLCCRGCATRASARKDFADLRRIEPTFRSLYVELTNTRNVWLVKIKPIPYFPMTIVHILPKDKRQNRFYLRKKLTLIAGQFSAQTETNLMTEQSE